MVFRAQPRMRTDAYGDIFFNYEDIKRERKELSEKLRTLMNEFKGIKQPFAAMKWWREMDKTINEVDGK